MPASIFEPTANGYAGRVRLFGIDEVIVLVAIEPGDGENTPAYRIQLDDEDGPDIGGAWKRVGERAGDYIALEIDSPLFPTQFRPALFQADDEGRTFRLAWKRPRARGSGLIGARSGHPFVPLGRSTACARSEGQGRPPAGACALPLTAARTLAGWSRCGDRAAWRCGVLLLVGALSVCAGSGVAVAQSALVERPTAAHPYAAHIAEASQRFGIPEHWIHAVLRAESAGDVRAVSSAGAMGLMQVMPDTWAGLRVRHQFGRDPYEPRDNIMAGTAYLREMWDRYGNVGAMLAAYNAGPGRYDEHRATGRPLPAEARAYVAALAPILGGATPSDAPSRQPAPSPDWRDAPLFVQRPDGSQSTVAPSTDAQSGDLFAAVSERDRR